MNISKVRGVSVRLFKDAKKSTFTPMSCRTRPSVGGSFSAGGDLYFVQRRMSWRTVPTGHGGLTAHDIRPLNENNASTVHHVSTQ